MSQAYTDTAVGLAFANAGYQKAHDKAYDRLLSLAKEALEAWPDNKRGCREQINAEMEEDLTWSLMLKDNPQALSEAISNLLQKARDALDQAKYKHSALSKNAGGGLRIRDTHTGTAPATLSNSQSQPHAAVPSSGLGQLQYDIQTAVAQPTTSLNEPDTGPAPVGGGHPDIGAHPQNAPATPSRDDAERNAVRRSEPARYAATPNNAVPAAPSPFGALIDRKSESQQVRPRPSLTLQADKQVKAMAAAVIVTKQSVLDMIIIRVTDNNVVRHKQLSDCTVAEANQWLIEDAAPKLLTRLVSYRFVGKLTSNLNGNVRIGEQWTPDAAAKEYENAKREVAISAQEIARSAQFVGAGA